MVEARLLSGIGGRLCILVVSKDEVRLSFGHQTTAVMDPARVSGD